MAATRISFNLFGVGFGIAGLAGAWLAAARDGPAPVAVGDTLMAVAAAVWVLTVAAYVRYAVATPGSLAADMVDPVGAPFASLAVITPMLLAVGGLAPHARTAGRVVFDVFLVLTVLLGGWFTGQWMHGRLVIDRLHPGYFLPTVAGGLVASEGAADVGQQRLAEVMLGLGLVCWLILGSMILARLLFRPALPAPLTPTLAIEVAPPAVASLAWLAIDGGRIDAVAAGLAGYGVLMVLAQLPFLPQFVRVPFGPSTWAFSFGWAAVATVALDWIEGDRVPGRTAYAWLVLAAITVLIGGIAGRTAVAVARGQFPPRAATPPAGSSAPIPLAALGTAGRA